ncbi:podocalyxin [Arapaima gigas]
MKCIWPLILFGLANQCIIFEVSASNSPNATLSPLLTTFSEVVSTKNSTITSIASTTVGTTNTVTFPPSAATSNSSMNISSTKSQTQRDSNLTPQSKFNSVLHQGPTSESKQSTTFSTSRNPSETPNVFSTSQSTVREPSSNGTSSTSPSDLSTSTHPPNVITVPSTTSTLRVSSSSTTLHFLTSMNLYVSTVMTTKEEEVNCTEVMMEFGILDKITSCKMEKGINKTNELKITVREDIIKNFLEKGHLTTPRPKPTYLVAILASGSVLLAIIIGIGIYTLCHRRYKRKNQQPLTDELHTTENGYHDNPTLEVMEVQPEMQEKKMVLNGEFNDSWIVPFDNIIKDDLPDEEDTHL